MSAPASNDSLCRVCHDLTFPENQSVEDVSDNDPFGGKADIMVLSDLSLFSPTLYDRDSPPKSVKFRYSAFHSDIEGLRLSAETCDACNMLLVLTEAKIKDPNVLKETKVVVTYPLNGREKQLRIWLMRGSECLFDLRLYAPYVCKRWNKVPVAPYVPPNTGGARSLPQVVEWMEDCDAHHLLCGPAQLPLLPSRVLEINGQNLRLHISSGEERGTYVCLSHCWGTSQVCTTTRKNIDSHIRAIDWDSLSGVFKDAITYTQTMGGKYIWIDSLCIIQDDQADWELESAKMADIYQNAVLTIAATHARTGTDGMFRNFKNSTFLVPLDDEPDVTETIHVRDRIDHITRRPWRNPEHFPLLSRAWVYQERYLSQRVLHFGPQEIFWECNETLRCQCSYLNCANDASSMFDLNFGVDSKSAHARCLFRGNPRVALADRPADIIESLVAEYIPEPKLLQIRWREMITEFTGLGITKPSDRLPALSGLAKQMKRHRATRYLAGLWEDTVFHDMLWLPVPIGGGRRQQVWQAPSWSWASMIGAVKYVGSETMVLEKDGAPKTIYMRDSGGSMQSAGGVAATIEGTSCRLLEANCSPAGLDLTGAVCSGYLKVAGFLLDVTKEISPLFPLNSDTLHGQHLIVNGVEASMSSDSAFWKHDNGELRLDCEIYALRIGCIFFVGLYEEWSLLLRQAEPGDNCFERCGIVSVMSKSPAREESKWFGSLSSETVITLL